MEEKEIKSVVQLVDTYWLSSRLSQTEMRIIDCQPNIHDYIQEHIPGSVYFNPALLRVPKAGRPGVYVPPQVVKELFDRIGLDNDTPTVVYTGKGPFKGWGDGLEQTMIAYSLARFGHNNVKVLDGGSDKWKFENLPMTKEFPDIEGSDFTVRTRDDYIIDYHEFNSIKDEDTVTVLDARPAKVYEGQGPWQKPGHIPGAVNLPWKSLMDEDNPRMLKPMEEVNAILEEKGVDRRNEIICTCGTGREATNEFLLLKFYLEYPNVRIYEGSFTEWSSIPDNPTVTGPDPR